MWGAGAVETGMPSEVDPGEGSTERMRVRAAVAGAPAWDLEAEGAVVVSAEGAVEAAVVEAAGEASGAVVAVAGGAVGGGADKRPIN